MSILEHDEPVLQAMASLRDSISTYEERTMRGSGARSRPLSIVPLVLVLFAASHAFGFDVARYRPGRLADMVRSQPTAAGVSVSPDVPIRATVVYSGEFQSLPDDSRRLIAAWGDSMNTPGLLEVFRQEVSVREGRSEYWIPIQQPLVAQMKDDLNPLQEIEVFVIYVGQVDRRHVFLLNAFDHEGPHGSRR